MARTRIPLRAAIAVGVVGLVTAVGGAALGSVSAAAQPSPQSWVHQLCTAASSWEQSIQTAESNLSSQAGSASSVTEAKSLLVGFLQGAVNDTKQLVQETGQIGTPNVKRGPAVAAYFRSGFVKVQKLFNNALADAKGLPTDSAGFNSGATAIGNRLHSEAAALSKQFTSLRGKFKIPSITAALNSDPTCQALKS